MLSKTPAVRSTLFLAKYVTIEEIGKLNYEVEHEQSASDDKSFVITGWTTKMKMQNNVVANCTKGMCELGYKFACEFDGWGTSPGP